MPGTMASAAVGMMRASTAVMMAAPEPMPEDWRDHDRVVTGTAVRNDGAVETSDEIWAPLLVW